MKQCKEELVKIFGGLVNDAGHKENARSDWLVLTSFCSELEETEQRAH